MPAFFTVGFCLDIALLVLGSTATFAAFGGKTWREGPEPILDRITARGWISATCLLLALVFGITKNVWDAKAKLGEKTADLIEKTKRDEEAASERAQAAADKAQAEIRYAENMRKEDKKQADLKADLAAAKSREDIANERLSALQIIDKLTQDRLGETTSTLGDVRKNLDSARDDLSQQSAAAFVNALANQDLTVKNISIFLPLTAKAAKGQKIRQAFLPKFDTPACRDLTNIMLGFEAIGDSEVLVFDHESDTYEQKFYTNDIPAYGYMEVPEPEEADVLAGLLKSLLKQDSWNGYLYTLQLHTEGRKIAAAPLYAALTRPGAVPFYIEASWPPTFANRDSFKAVSSRYADYLDAGMYQFLPKKEEFTLMTQKPLPSSCRDQMRTQFDQAFEKAMMIIELDGKTAQTMMLRLSAHTSVNEKASLEGDVVRDGIWKVSFSIDSAPLVTVGKTLEANGPNDWPQPKAKPLP